MFYIFEQIQSKNKVYLSMKKKGALKILLVFLIIFLTNACSKKESDQIKLDPLSFKIFVSENSSSTSSIMWENSDIADKSKLLYDVYLNGELKQSDVEEKIFFFDGLDEDTEYNTKVVAKSNYNTQKESSIKFKTFLNPTPKPLEYVNEVISATSIKLVWARTNDKDILTYDLFLNDKKIESKLNAEEYTFTDLEPKTDYNIKIIGISEFDKSTEISKKYTTKDFVDPEGFELSFSDLTTSEVMLKWTISPSDDQLSSGLIYKIFVNDIDKGLSLKTNSYKLTGLEEKTKYKIEVEAINKYGKSKKKGVIIKTKEFIEAKQVSDFDVVTDEIGVEYVHLHLETKGDEDAVCVFDVKVDDQYIGRFLNKEVFTCVNLSAETNYVFEVVAKNSSDICRSKKQTIKTLPEPTLADFGVSTKNITTKSVVLKWTECVASDLSEICYKVYDSNGTLLIQDLKKLEYIPSSILVAGETYTYKIVACHRNGKLIREKLISFTTFENPEINIQNKVIGTNSVNLSWGVDLKNIDYLNLNGYTVLIKQLQTKLSMDNSCVINCLQSNSEYTLVISAKYTDVYSSSEVVITKEVEFRTKDYPSVIDYKLSVYSNFFHTANLSLADFKAKNNSIFEDFSSFLYKVYIDGKIQYLGSYKDIVSFEGLEAKSLHSIQLTVIHSDGSIITNKSIWYTCGSNNDPVWSNPLAIDCLSSSYVLFDNLFAKDELDNLKVSKYKYYINNKLITVDTHIEGAGRVSVGANNVGQKIWITNLSADSDYSFYMEAEDTEGAIIRTNKVLFRTSPIISNLKVLSNIEAKLYDIFWDKNGDINKIDDIRIEVLRGEQNSVIYSENNFFLFENDDQFMLRAKNIKDISGIDKLRIVIYWKNTDISRFSLSRYINIM